MVDPARQGLCGVRCLDVAVDARTLLLPRNLCRVDGSGLAVTSFSHSRPSLLQLGFRFRRLALFRPGLGLALGWAYPSKELVKLCPPLPPDADVQRREKLCKHDSPVGTQREDAVVQ